MGNISWSYCAVRWLHGVAYQVFGSVVLIADQGSEESNLKLARSAWRRTRVEAHSK